MTCAYANGLGCERGTERVFGAPFAELERRWLADALQPGDPQGAEPAPATNLVPFLVLLGLILVVPLALAFSGRRRNGK